jgi:hypothetical protein
MSISCTVAGLEPANTLASANAFQPDPDTLVRELLARVIHGEQTR